MNKVQHPSNNKVLGAPQDWDQKRLPCGALAVTLSAVGDTPCVVSYWKPTPDELVALNCGQYVALHVVGTTMPPVAIEVMP